MSALCRALVKTLGVLLVLVAVWFGYRHFTGPISHAPGILIATEPEQTELPAATAAISHREFQLKPLAHFSVDARLLHRKNYRYDNIAKLAPTDLALGWGEMSDQSVVDRLTISQSSRFYWYEYQLPPPIPQEAIVRHSTNVHIIPADDAVRAECKSLRAGELIHLDGELVEVTGPGIASSWRSSLRRDDSGNGACEVLLAEHVWRIEPTPPAPAARLVRR
jgi:hypothetical protein